MTRRLFLYALKKVWSPATLLLNRTVSFGFPTTSGPEWKISPSFCPKYLWLASVAPVTASRSPQMKRRELPASVSVSGEPTAGGNVCGANSALRVGHQLAPVAKVMSYRFSGTASAAGIGRLLRGLGIVCGSEK